VITRQQGWHAPSVEVAHSLPEAFFLSGPADMFVIGGSDVYRQALPFADQMLLTEIDQSPEADTFFPEFNRSEWSEVSREPQDGFAYVTYVRRLPRSPRPTG
jgi:dihydrofolate reductase